MLLSSLFSILDAYSFVIQYFGGDLVCNEVDLQSLSVEILNCLIRFKTACKFKS